MNHVNHVWVVEKQRDNGEWDITYLPENPGDNTEKFMRYMVASAPDDEPRRVRRYVDPTALLEAAKVLCKTFAGGTIIADLRKAVKDITSEEDEI